MGKAASRAVVGLGSLDPWPVARPGLGARFPGLDEEREVGATVRAQQCYRVGMVQARQVEEVAVLAERVIGIAGTRPHSRADENSDGVGPHGLAKALAAQAEHRRSLPPYSSCVHTTVRAAQ